MSTPAIHSDGSTYDINSIKNLCLVTFQYSTCLSQSCVPIPHFQGLCAHPQSCQQSPQKQRPKKVPCAETANLLFPSENSGKAQAKDTPQDCYLTAAPAQLQLFQWASGVNQVWALKWKQLVAYFHSIAKFVELQIKLHLSSPRTR